MWKVAQGYRAGTTHLFASAEPNRTSCVLCCCCEDIWNEGFSFVVSDIQSIEVVANAFRVNATEINQTPYGEK